MQLESTLDRWYASNTEERALLAALEVGGYHIAFERGAGARYVWLHDSGGATRRSNGFYASGQAAVANAVADMAGLLKTELKDPIVCVASLDKEFGEQGTMFDFLQNEFDNQGVVAHLQGVRTVAGFAALAQELSQQAAPPTPRMR